MLFGIISVNHNYLTIIFYFWPTIEETDRLVGKEKQIELSELFQSFIIPEISYGIRPGSLDKELFIHVDNFDFGMLLSGPTEFQCTEQQ